jgi:hypothetical protein
MINRMDTRARNCHLSKNLHSPGTQRTIWSRLDTDDLISQIHRGLVGRRRSTARAPDGYAAFRETKQINPIRSVTRATAAAKSDVPIRQG